MRTSSDGKPVPEVTDLTRPFWAAALEGRLVMQKCGRCSNLNFFPKPWCVECGDRNLAWVDIRPTGTIYSYTISPTVVMNLPGWKSDLPVILCLIDLDDGPRMYAQLTDCSVEGVCIGMRVVAHFRKVADDVAMPLFRPE